MTIFKRKAAMHPNGFWVYVAKVFWNGARIRVHYWPKGVKRLDTPHNHRSWFVSIPLFGKFTETRFKETPGNDYEVLKCHATASGGNGKPLTTPSGVGNVVAVSSRRRYLLIPYFCGRKVIHAFVPHPPSSALTIVLFGPPKKTPKAWIAKP